MYIVLYSGVYSYFDWILYFEERTSHPSLVSLLLLIQYALFLIRKKQKQKKKKKRIIFDIAGHTGKVMIEIIIKIQLQ